MHSRILKDPNTYTRSMVVLSKLALVEGDSGAALKLAISSH